MQTRWIRMIVFVTTALLSAGAARAQDIPAGKAIAQVWCSNCHRVDPQEKTAARNDEDPASE
jgi:mono/diheme cytochrome c family protein